MADDDDVPVVVAASSCLYVLPHAVNSAEGSVFGAVSPYSLFVYEISPEPLNGFAPNSHGRRVWSLTRTSMKVKVEGSIGTRTTFFR